MTDAADRGEGVTEGGRFRLDTGKVTHLLDREDEPIYHALCGRTFHKGWCLESRGYRLCKDCKEAAND